MNLVISPDALRKKTRWATVDENVLFSPQRANTCLSWQHVWKFPFYSVFLMKPSLLCRNFWSVERFARPSESFAGMEWFLSYYFFSLLVRITTYLWSSWVFLLSWFIRSLKENELSKRALDVDYQSVPRKRRWLPRFPDRALRVIMCYWARRVFLAVPLFSPRWNACPSPNSPFFFSTITQVPVCIHTSYWIILLVDSC